MMHRDKQYYLDNVKYILKGNPVAVEFLNMCKRARIEFKAPDSPALPEISFFSQKFFDTGVIVKTKQGPEFAFYEDMTEFTLYFIWNRVKAYKNI